VVCHRLHPFFFHDCSGQGKSDQLTAERVSSLSVVVQLRDLDLCNSLADALLQQIKDSLKRIWQNHH